MAGPKPWTDNFGIEPGLKSCVIVIQAHFLCLQERSAPVSIQLVIHQPMSEVFRRFSLGVLKRCHQVYPLSIFPLKRKLWSLYFVESIIQGSSKFHHTSFFSSCPKCDRLEARNLNWHIAMSKAQRTEEKPTAEPEGDLLPAAGSDPWQCSERAAPLKAS